MHRGSSYTWTLNWNALSDLSHVFNRQARAFIPTCVLRIKAYTRLKLFRKAKPDYTAYIIIIIIIIIVGSKALGVPWPPQANVARCFHNPFSMCLPLPRQSILISVGHVLVDLQSLSITSL
jgi:hypothetical protein